MSERVSVSSTEFEHSVSEGNIKVLSNYSPTNILKPNEHLAILKVSKAFCKSHEVYIDTCKLAIRILEDNSKKRKQIRELEKSCSDLTELTVYQEQQEKKQYETLKALIKKNISLKQENSDFRSQMLSRFDSMNALLEGFAKENVELKKDVAALKEDVATLKKDVATLKEDVAALKQDVAALKKDNIELNTRLTLLESDIELANVVNALKCSFILFTEQYLKGGDEHWTEKIERHVRLQTNQVYSLELTRHDLGTLWDFYIQNKKKYICPQINNFSQNDENVIPLFNTFTKWAATIYDTIHTEH